MKKLNQSGMLDVTMIVVITLVLGIGGLAYWRINGTRDAQLSSNSNKQASDQIQALPDSLESLKTLEEIELISEASNGVTIISFELESEDDKYLYKIVLSDGRKLVIDASTGAILSEEKTDVSDDDLFPSGVEVTTSLSEVYALAKTHSSSPIKKIELEVEDKKIVYKIEFKDGSKLEVDASTGSILKSEDGEDEEDDDEDEEDEEDDDEEEDDEDEEDEE